MGNYNHKMPVKKRNKEKKKRFVWDLLIVLGVIVLASILGAISGKLLLDHMI